MGLCFGWIPSLSKYVGCGGQSGAPKAQKRAADLLLLKTYPIHLFLLYLCVVCSSGGDKWGEGWVWVREVRVRSRGTGFLVLHLVVGWGFGVGDNLGICWG